MRNTENKQPTNNQPDDQTTDGSLEALILLGLAVAVFIISPMGKETRAEIFSSVKSVDQALSNEAAVYYFRAQ